MCLVGPVPSHPTPPQVVGSWAGHYEMHAFDHNGVIGPHPTVPNFHFACGFSGHGLQHAPATGRAVAEGILFGRQRALDLSPLGYQRVLDNKPLVEINIV